MDINDDVAELMGILTGDGFINYYPKRQAYLIEIAGNKLKDEDYLNKYVRDLIENLFNFVPRFYTYKNQNTIRLVVRSKKIFSFLKEIGFPTGRKEEISIPNWILKNEQFFKRFVKGVFDTDGCLCLKNKEGKKYPVVSISSKSKTLLIPVKEFLRSYNISSYLDKYSSKNEKRYYQKEWEVYKLQINGKKNISLFFKVIGSENKRNLAKYEEFLSL